MASDLFQQNVQIEGGLLANIPTMRREKRFRAAAALDFEHGQKVSFRIELGRSSKLVNGCT